MIRRSFFAAFALLPVSAGVAASIPSITRAQHTQLIALIEELESSPGYQMAAVCWARAHVAGQIREALGLEVPASQDRLDYLEFDLRKRIEAERREGALL